MEIVGLVIGIIALLVGVMALPTVFQMYGGAPKIGVECVKLHRNDGAALAFSIVNMPVRSRPLLALGVYRAPTDITADFEVREFGTNRVVVPITRAYVSTDKDKGVQVSLATSMPAHALVGTVYSGRSAVHHSDGETGTVLNQGKYTVILGVNHTMHKRTEWTAELVVGVSDSYWQPDSLRRHPA